MIETFDSKDIFDLMYDCAAAQNCAFVYFHNDSLLKCEDQNLIDSVYSYYEEFLPDDILRIIKGNKENVIKFLSPDSASMNALSWFPKKDQLIDESGNPLPDEYYFKCYAIDKEGIFYFN